jgi:hypothetical protein
MFLCSCWCEVCLLSNDDCHLKKKHDDSRLQQHFIANIVMVVMVVFPPKYSRL